MTRVVLHGILGQVVGRPDWLLNVKGPAEALRAIEANTKKLFKFLADYKEGKALYRVVLDGKDFDNIEQLAFPHKSYETIHFIPVIEGAESGGVWQTVVGAILLIAAVALFVFAPEGYFAEHALAALAVGMIFSVGASLTLGGIAQLIAGSPRSPRTNEKPDNQPSYLFSGAVNTIRQGNPVPLCYGRMRTGSQVISVNLTATDIPTSEQTSIPPKNFYNIAAITINDNAAASPYASIIQVTNLVSSQVKKVKVTLSNLTHTSPADLDILLVAPSGKKILLMSDVGGNVSISNVTLTFDGTLSTPLSQNGPLVTGLFSPTNFDIGNVDSFFAPAPAAPYADGLIDLIGTNLNGNWLLYIVDDNSSNTGSVANGWGLVFEL